MIPLWSPTSLVFLDEVSFDSRDMRRTRGYSPKGQKLIITGESTRSPRISLLCFAGVTGMLETFMTDGTFTRHKFFECIRSYAQSGKKSHLTPAHGVFGLWTVPGSTVIPPLPTTCPSWASKHVHAVIFCAAVMLMGNHCVRQVIFLPAYAPFFNPIEIFFSAVKAKMRRRYTPKKSEFVKFSTPDNLPQF